MSSDCLIEVGTEELPPRALQSLAQNFAGLMQKALSDNDLAPAAVEVFATPRRLALLNATVWFGLCPTDHPA